MKKGIVAVIGLGLIGGSLALALKRYTPHTVYGYDACEATSEQALQTKAIDGAATNIAEAVQAADVVIFCLPVSDITAKVAEAVPYLKTGAIISDVAGTKDNLLTAVPDLLPLNVNYVGGHPMTGSEKSGFSAASADLFIDRPYILTLQKETDSGAVETLKELVSAIGAMPMVIDGVVHDAIAAQISHVPHVTAAALVMMANCSKHADLNFALAAGGFRDMTRIASANPAMWTDICLTNKQEIINGLLDLQKIISQVVANLNQGDAENLIAFFSEAKKIRDDLFNSF